MSAASVPARVDILEDHLRGLLSFLLGKNPYQWAKVVREMPADDRCRFEAALVAAGVA